MRTSACWHQRTRRTVPWRATPGRLPSSCGTAPTRSEGACANQVACRPRPCSNEASNRCSHPSKMMRLMMRQGFAYSRVQFRCTVQYTTYSTAHVLAYSVHTSSTTAGTVGRRKWNVRASGMFANTSPTFRAENRSFQCGCMPRGSTAGVDVWLRMMTS